MSMKVKFCAALMLGATTTMSFAGPGHDVEFGKPGTEATVDRVIEVSMTEMKFSPDAIEVVEGETVKFVIRNDGRAIHEFNIGIDETWQAHRKEMRKMFKMGMMNMRGVNHEKMEASGMMHDDPNSLLLEPGAEAELIWTFTEAGDYGFACNVPGHFEAGMAGAFDFQGAEQS